MLVSEMTPTIPGRSVEEELLAKGVNLGLQGMGYQVRLCSKSVVVENEDGDFLFRCHSLNAAVTRIQNELRELNDDPTDGTGTLYPADYFAENLA